MRDIYSGGLNVQVYFFFKWKLAFDYYIRIRIKITCLVFSLPFSPMIYTLNQSQAAAVLITKENSNRWIDSGIRIFNTGNCRANVQGEWQEMQKKRLAGTSKTLQITTNKHTIRGWRPIFKATLWGSFECWEYLWHFIVNVRNSYL